MEEFWQTGFACFFRRFFNKDGDVWTFQPVTAPPPVDEYPWHTCSYTAKVRFICDVSVFYSQFFAVL